MDLELQKNISKMNKKNWKRWKRWKIDNKTKEYLINYYENINKYPTSYEINQLSNQFNVTDKNIKIFFQNRRQRNKKDIIDNKFEDDLYNLYENNIINKQFEKENEQILFKKSNLDYKKLCKIYILSIILKNLFYSQFNYIMNLNFSYFLIETNPDFYTDNEILNLLYLTIINDKKNNPNLTYKQIKKSILCVLQNI